MKDPHNILVPRRKYNVVPFHRRVIEIPAFSWTHYWRLKAMLIHQFCCWHEAARKRTKRDIYCCA